MYKYILSKRPVVVLFLILAFVTPLIEVEGTYIYYNMFNSVGENNMKKVMKLMLLGIIVYIIHGLLRYWINIIIEHLVSKARENLKNDCIEKVLSRNFSSFGQEDVGIYISKFTNDISLLEYKYFQAVLNTIESLFSILIVGVAVVNLRFSLSVVIITGEILSILICFAAKKHSIAVNNNYFKTLASFTNTLKDFFSCFFLYKNYGVEDKIISRFNEKNSLVEDSKNDADVTVNFVSALSKLCTSLIKFTVVGLGVIYLVAFEGRFGEIYIAYQFTKQIFSPTQNIIYRLNDINSVNGIIKNFKSMMTSTNPIAFDKTNTKKSLDINICFKGVSLSKGEKNILDNVSVSFEKGKKYLVIGKNGSGKSSLLRLLKGYDSDYTGEIFINGVELSEYDSKNLSEMIVYINEQVSLFCDTVHNNITMYKDYPEDEIVSAVKMAGLRVELDRTVTDGEINLSSGERRRIELARAYLCQAPALIFDEAISTLDIETSYGIEKNMLEMKDRTVIFVSHNFSTSLLKNYDSIILLSDGRIVDQGTHDQLIMRSELYKKIMKIKSGERSLCNVSI